MPALQVQWGACVFLLCECVLCMKGRGTRLTNARRVHTESNQTLPGTGLVARRVALLTPPLDRAGDHGEERGPEEAGDGEEDHLVPLWHQRELHALHRQPVQQRARVELPEARLRREPHGVKTGTRTQWRDARREGNGTPMHI